MKHPDVSVKVSIPALNEYFSFQNIFSDLTLFEGIKLLNPANTLSLKLGDTTSLRKEQYWDYNFRDIDNLSDIDEKINLLLEG